tara:strand:- start:1550 stop:1774 length:225 start_codon:yes stop_codon:yes gene_type:complete
MQKLINVLALSSFVVSGAIIGGGVYLYVQKDAILDKVKDNIKEQVLGGVTDALPGMVGDAVPDLPSTTGPALPF